jgi:hypothetical protein
MSAPSHRVLEICSNFLAKIEKVTVNLRDRSSHSAVLPASESVCMVCAIVSITEILNCILLNSADLSTKRTRYMLT